MIKKHFQILAIFCYTLSSFSPTNLKCDYSFLKDPKKSYLYVLYSENGTQEEIADKLISAMEEAFNNVKDIDPNKIPDNTNDQYNQLIYYHFDKALEPINKLITPDMRFLLHIKLRAEIRLYRTGSVDCF